jgi:hypothetical protein
MRAALGFPRPSSWLAFAIYIIAYAVAQTGNGTTPTGAPTNAPVGGASGGGDDNWNQQLRQAQSCFTPVYEPERDDKGNAYKWTGASRYGPICNIQHLCSTYK